MIRGERERKICRMRILTGKFLSHGRFRLDKNVTVRAQKIPVPLTDVFVSML